MYLELKESVTTDGASVLKRYPGRAYMLVNVYQPVVDGVTLDFHGCLYAVADKVGLERLYATARDLESSGITAFIDTFPLDDGEALFTGMQCCVRR